jgi:hypothetical protein
MTESELAGAGRDVLLGLIAELQAALTAAQTTLAEHQTAITALQKRIRTLEQQLTSRTGPGMPGNKPTPPKPKPAPKDRKKRARGFGRPRMIPTQAVAHAVEHWPDCGTALVGGWVQRTRQVLELPLAPVQVTEHQYVARECPLCRTRHVPPVELAGVVLGERHRLGIGLVSLSATLREEGRLRFQTIRW